jgi:hypothetical protein
MKRFLSMLAVLVAGSCPTGALGSDGGAPALPGARGGRVDWARLVTPDKNWDIHSDRDPDLAEFIRRNTNLSIDATWYAADPARLEQLCTYPFIYAKDLTLVRNPAHLANIREYLARGGFICVDACATINITPDMEAYYRGNCAIFERMFPGAVIRQVPETHGVYTCYFKVGWSDIYTRDMGVHTPMPHDGIYGVFVGDRMVALLSMYGLQCGWPQTPMRTPGCMKLILNAYVYAMTAAPEKPVAPQAELPASAR